MDLSRYKNIIIHVDGHDIDIGISPDSFKEKYQSLLDYLKTVNSKLFEPGLLPRGGIDMKIFNTILKDLCLKSNVDFIDIHNSFNMASGELPFDFFHADQVNLKFSGIRKLVHNINESCAVLPQTQNFLRHHNTNRGHLQQNPCRPIKKQTYLEGRITSL